MPRDNNKKDTEKVLKTVFACALDYLSTSTDSVLIFYGNTTVKHRLYKGQINKNIKLIKKYFIIIGGIITDLELKETLENGKEPNEPVNLNNLIYQQYDPQNSRNYSFITLGLNLILMC
jgi:hypothetical protein